MKKRIPAMCLAAAVLCTACGDIGTGEKESEQKESVDLRLEIGEALENASYGNLEILFDEMAYYEGQDLVVAHVSSYHMIEDMEEEEVIKFYIEEAIPNLLGVDALDLKCVYEGDSYGYNEEEGRYDGILYEDVLASLDDYEEMPEFIYKNMETYASFEYTFDWTGSVNASQGVLGTYAGSESPFGAYGSIKTEKNYDCRLDDLSDSYMLLDGEKTVAEAKEEIESYFDAHYPIWGEENGIKNEVYEINVGKITGTDYYAFQAYRSYSYNGIPFRVAAVYPGTGELALSGNCALCESSKVDVTIGPVNNYKEPKPVRTITECIPFADVLDAVAVYLTGETRFQLLYGNIEYRIFTMEKGLQMVPYWSFTAKNPNDDKMMKIYVDIETGEITTCSY